jgi:hypothetical protein
VEKLMIAQFMVQPSALMRSGIQMSQLGEVYLFKFNDSLQDRFEELLLQKKQTNLTHEEQAELEGISELSRIFTLINAQLATQAKWCPTKFADLSDNVPNHSVSTATPPNI